MDKNNRDEFKEISESFVKFSNRQAPWLYLLIIVLILFGVASLYQLIDKNTDNQELNLVEQVQLLEEKVQAQESKLEELEAQIKELQTINQ